MMKDSLLAAAAAIAAERGDIFAVKHIRDTLGCSLGEAYLQWNTYAKGVRSSTTPPATAPSAPSPAAQAAAAIVHDLVGRRGLKWEWQKIDDDIKAEIVETWTGIIERFCS